MVLRWDILTSWKYMLGGTVGLATSIALFNILKLYLLRNSFGIDPYAEVYFRESANSFVIGVGIVAFFVLACCIFVNMKTKLKRENFLMLPASNLEKYVSRLLLSTVGAVIAIFGALVLGDMVQFIFSFIITPNFHESISWHVISRFFTSIADNFDWHKSLLIYSFLLFAHSFCTLGGTIYRKVPYLLTACTALLLGLLIGYVIDILNEAGLFDFMSHTDFSRGTMADYCAQTIWLTVFLGLSVFNYWASYKLFTRMQVICNKWINI